MSSGEGCPHSFPFPLLSPSPSHSPSPLSFPLPPSLALPPTPPLSVPPSVMCPRAKRDRSVCTCMCALSFGVCDTYMYMYTSLVWLVPSPSSLPPLYSSLPSLPPSLPPFLPPSKVLQCVDGDIHRRGCEAQWQSCQPGPVLGGRGGRGEGTLQ